MATILKSMMQILGLNEQSGAAYISSSLDRAISPATLDAMMRGKTHCPYDIITVLRYAYEDMDKEARIEMKRLDDVFRQARRYPHYLAPQADNINAARIKALAILRHDMPIEFDQK